MNPALTHIRQDSAWITLELNKKAPQHQNVKELLK